MTLRRAALLLAPLAAGTVVAAVAARASAPLACPGDARRVEARPPAGPEEWCERPGADGRAVREGPYRAYYPDGRLKVEGRFAAGRKTGRWTYWHGNGLAGGRGRAREAGEYREGREHGAWTRWHASGIPRETGEYRDGVRAGRWTFWTEIGVKEREGEYRDGQPVGVWHRWNAQGVACPPEDRGQPAPEGEQAWTSHSARTSSS